MNEISWWNKILFIFRKLQIHTVFNIRERKSKFRVNAKSNWKLSSPTIDISFKARMQVKTTSRGVWLTPFPIPPSRTRTPTVSNIHDNASHPAGVSHPNSRSTWKAHSLGRARRQHTPLTKVQVKCVRENQSCTEWGRLEN